MAVSPATRKPIGSQWLFNPDVAGYGTVWRPAVATIHGYVMPEDVQPPTKGGVTPPRRDYTVTLPGGLFLFANEESLSDKDAPPVSVMTAGADAPEVFKEVDLSFPHAST